MTDSVTLIVAAGRGERAGGGLPKQYRKLSGAPVLRRSVEAFLPFGRVAVVIGEGDQPLYEDAVAGLDLPPSIYGGATRQASVRNGLEALAAARPSRVLIHDGARPLVSHALIGRLLAALDGADGCAPMLAVADTLRRKRGAGYEIVSRDGLLRAQTPQGFHFDAILDAHRRFAAETFTDDFALAERAGLKLAAVPGEETNLKLTTQEDFALAERLAATAFETRTGTGFDVHRFAAGDGVWMCGIEIPHSEGLEGHSDADVGLHALTDAILGAAAAGDIGTHFPPDDERWRGAPSHLFLRRALELLQAQGGTLCHVDVTIICERPKVAPYRDAMRARLSEILNLSLERVSVKATTTEGLGFTGRREGIAAQAVATARFAI